MMNKKSGIYIIKNVNNNKIYVGSSININKRINRHFNELRKNKHYNKHLQNSFDYYGEKSFIYEIVEENILKENLNIKEQYYIDKYKSYNYDVGYNICKLAYTTMGYKHTEETKLKMSIEKNNNPEKYARHGKTHWNYGNTHTEETKLKMSINHANFKGENSCRAKLNGSKINKIRNLYLLGKHTYKDLGKLFFVSDRTIGKIIRRETWNHI